MKKKPINKFRIVIIIMVVIIGALFLIKTITPRYYNYKARCSKGWYYLVTYLGIFGEGCRECPKGSYCPGDDKSYNCPRGLTTFGNRKESSKDCKFCVDDSKWYDGNSCVSCPKGSYCEYGYKTSCPVGMTTKNVGSRRESACVCKEGTYLSNGKCVSCPSGFTSSVDSRSINKCSITVPQGKYITCNKDNCKINTCADNSYSAKSQKVNYKTNLKTTCTKCPNGKVANSSHTACVCKAGTYLSNGKCVSCPKCNGNVTCFTTLNGATSASQCTGTVPAGSYIKCSKSGCEVNKCAGNTYSNRRSVSYSTTLSTSCTSCGNNKVNNNHTACNIEPTKTSCPKGEYLTDGKCKSCPKCNGTLNCFTTSSNATLSSDCTGTVPAGKYIKCTAISCVVKDCTGNTYSKKKYVTYSTNLQTTCTSCGTKKANSDHTGCK